MKRHLAYLKYVIRHKYFVYTACRIAGISFLQALLHDWTKFLPSEWRAYAETFYKPDGANQYVPSPEFELAWRHHQRRNPHHWQYWLLTWDKGHTTPLEMPDKYLIEMVCDWLGAGKAITGKWSAWDWYEKNKAVIQLHPSTRATVETILENAKTRFINK